MRIAADAFCGFVSRWAADRGRKITAEPMSLAPNAVEIRGVDGDGLSAEDVTELTNAAKDYDVHLVAHSATGDVWMEKEFHEVLARDFGGSLSKPTAEEFLRAGSTDADED